MSDTRTQPMVQPVVEGFYHAPTFSVAYVVSDPDTKQAAIIDPVLDFDEKSGRVSTEFSDRMLEHVRNQGLTVTWLLDTHPHADHFSAAPYLKELTGAPTAIGERVRDVQSLWKGIYNLGDEVPADGSQWDRLFADGDTFSVGNIPARVIFSPGHTLASITYIIGDAAFVHDTLFQPDFGTARADFPGGDAGQLYDSMMQILELPPSTRLFTGHDYKPGGREPQWETTVEAQRRDNKHLGGGINRDAFIQMRKERDATLPLPKLMLAALQVNIRGGRLPEPEGNGQRYLKIPLNQFA